MNDPGVRYVCSASAPSAEPGPSPNSHRYVSGSPSGSRATAWNQTSSGAGPDVRSADASTIAGGALPGSVTVTVTSSEAVSPSSSVTVTVAVCGPGAVSVRLTVCPNASPSANSQRYESAPPSGSSPSALNVTASGAGPPGGSANACTLGAPGSAPPSIENASLPTAPTLPATSVARCSSVWSPAALTVTAPAYTVHAPPSSRYSSPPSPDPPAGSAPASVIVTGPSPLIVAALLGAVRSTFTVTDFAASTFPAASVER